MLNSSKFSDKSLFIEHLELMLQNNEISIKETIDVIKEYRTLDRPDNIKLLAAAYFFITKNSNHKNIALENIKTIADDSNSEFQDLAMVIYARLSFRMAWLFEGDERTRCFNHANYYALKALQLNNRLLIVFYTLARLLESHPEIEIDKTHFPDDLARDENPIQQAVYLFSYVLKNDRNHVLSLNSLAYLLASYSKINFNNKFLPEDLRGDINIQTAANLYLQAHQLAPDNPNFLISLAILIKKHRNVKLDNLKLPESVRSDVNAQLAINLHIHILSLKPNHVLSLYEIANALVTHPERVDIDKLPKNYVRSNKKTELAFDFCCLSLQLQKYDPKTLDLLAFLLFQNNESSFDLKKIPSEIIGNEENRLIIIANLLRRVLLNCADENRIKHAISNLALLIVNHGVSITDQDKRSDYSDALQAEIQKKRIPTSTGEQVETSRASEATHTHSSIPSNIESRLEALRQYYIEPQGRSSPITTPKSSPTRNRFFPGVVNLLPGMLPPAHFFATAHIPPPTFEIKFHPVTTPADVYSSLGKHERDDDVEKFPSENGFKKRK